MLLRLKIVLSVCLLVGFLGFSQDKEGNIYLSVDVRPKHGKCDESAKPEACTTEQIFKFIQSEIFYPIDSRRNKIEGTVEIEFVINKRGKVRKVKVLHGVNEELDEEAKRVIKKLPRFEPAKKDGKAVAFYYVIPITFQL